MRKTLLLTLGMAVIPAGIDAQICPAIYVDRITPVIEEVRKCADEGDDLAQYYLGSLYERGWIIEGFLHPDWDDTDQDLALAAQWYQRSVKYATTLDLPYLRLGHMYYTGMGVPQDFVLSYMWFNLAAALTNRTENASTNREIVRREMTREQIADAQQLTREWIAAHPRGGN